MLAAIISALAWSPCGPTGCHWPRAALSHRVIERHGALRCSAEDLAPGALSQKFAEFPRTWVPVASTFELIPDKPTPVRFLDQSYVAFQDNDGEWRLMDDSCPHRLAPLSEGRIDREMNRIECAYHGWSFEPSSGACARIPQANEVVAKAAMPSARACVASYPTRVHKSVLWAWPWEEDCLSVVDDVRAQPEGFLDGVADDASTYTRDLPYSWDTLLENIVDPAHIPFAHHGLQGKREDAIPINMTNPTPVDATIAAAGGAAPKGGLRGFEFEFGDRTMGKRRAGTGEFRAPFVVAYNADFEPTIDKKGNARPSRPFNLTVVCVPTASGQARAIIYGGAQPTQRKKGKGSGKAVGEAGSGGGDKVSPQMGVQKKPAASLLGRVFKLLPVWLIHVGSNRFLDSDLAFLHYQEQGVQARGGDAAGCYYMPTPSDRCIVALRKWIDTHAPAGIAGLRPLPPAIYSRDVLFDRWTQHTSHCKHCERSATSCHATSPTASRPRPCLACRATSCAVRPLSQPTRHHPQSPLMPLAFDAGRRPSGGGRTQDVAEQHASTPCRGAAGGRALLAGAAGGRGVPRIAAPLRRHRAPVPSGGLRALAKPVRERRLTC